MAALSAPLLVRGLPSTLGAQIQFLGGPVLFFVTGIAIVASLLCGVVPAWRRTQPGWFSALQEGGRGGSGSVRSHRARSALVIVQVALSLLLLAAAGLLLTSLRALERVETGFQPRRPLAAHVSLPESVYDKDEKQENFYHSLQDNLQAISGVKSPASGSAPFADEGGSSSFFIEGRPAGPHDPGPHGNVRLISPDYFRTLEIPLLRGREFTPQDRAGSERVAVVDTVLAHQYWPGKSHRRTYRQ